MIRHGQTEFNRLFGATRVDPGIRDPVLTPVGLRQAAALSNALSTLPGPKIRRLIASPYRRALETAEAVAQVLGLPITVDALVAERFVYACDIGSARADLAARWPQLSFDHLIDPWWPQTEESEETLMTRVRNFRRRVLDENWSEIAVVTHWGFIRALTGLKVANGTVVRIDPTRPEESAATIFLPPAE